MASQFTVNLTAFDWLLANAAHIAGLLWCDPDAGEDSEIFEIGAGVFNYVVVAKHFAKHGVGRQNVRDACVDFGDSVVHLCDGRSDRIGFGRRVAEKGFHNIGIGRRWRRWRGAAAAAAAAGPVLVLVRLMIAQVALQVPSRLRVQRE